MAQEIIFNLGVNAGNADSAVDGLKKSVDDVGASVDKTGDKFAKRLEEIKKRVDSGMLSQRELTRAVKEYQTIALQAGETTPIGQQAIQEAGQLKDRLEDVSAQINVAAKDGANLQAALQLGSTITAGYGAVQGITALMGSESETLTKTLVKLQAVQTTLVSIEQIRLALEKESFLMTKLKTAQTWLATTAQTVYTAAIGTSTGAMKALKIAMLSLPILAIIAGITALVAALAYFFSETEKAQEATDKLNASIEANAEATERANDKITRSIQNRIRLMELQGATQEEINKEELRLLDAGEAARRNQIKEELRQINERRKNLIQAQKEGNDDLAKSIQDEIAANRKKYKDLKNLDGQYEEDRKAKILEQENEAAEVRKEANDKAAGERKRAAEQRAAEEKKRAEELLNLQHTITDLTIANIADQETRERLALAEKHKRELEDLKKQYGERAELINALQDKQTIERRALDEQQNQAQIAITKEADAKRAEAARVSEKAELEAKLLNGQLEFEARQELLREQAALEREQALLNKELTAGEQLKIEAEYTAKLAELKKAEQESEENKNKAIAESRAAMQQNVQTVVSALGELFRKNSAASKVAAIADVSIQAATGFVDGLRLAQKAALETPTPIGKALVFASFAATQALAVKKVVDQAKTLIGAGPSVSPPSAPTPTTSGGTTGTGNNEQGTALAPTSVTQIVLPIDSLKKAQSQSEIVTAISTIG